MEGGARTIIDGLVAAGCTVLVPAFSDEFGVAPLPTMHRLQNGSDYDWVMRKAWPGVGKIYTPASNAIEKAEMGAIPAAVLQTVHGGQPWQSPALLICGGWSTSADIGGKPSAAGS